MWEREAELARAPKLLLEVEDQLCRAGCELVCGDGCSLLNHPGSKHRLCPPSAGCLHLQRPAHSCGSRGKERENQQSKAPVEQGKDRCETRSADGAGGTPQAPGGRFGCSVQGSTSPALRNKTQGGTDTEREGRRETRAPGHTHTHTRCDTVG